MIMKKGRLFAFLFHHSAYFCTANITEIVADSGVITDGSGPYNYRNGNFCRWKLLPANAQQLVLTFNLLDIDSTDNLRIKIMMEA